MTRSFAPLPRRCPVGFEFEVRKRRHVLVGREGGVPRFSDGERDDLTGSALETEAALAFREHETRVALQRVARVTPAAAEEIRKSLEVPEAGGVGSASREERTGEA